MREGCGLLLASFGLSLTAFVFGVLASAPQAAPDAPALTAEYWTPCEPPRPGVECWRSGHAVVCLPTDGSKP